MGWLTGTVRQHFLSEVVALGKILIYLLVVLFLGCVLAPPIYWMLHQTVDFPFYRYFSRVIQVVAFVLLVPLLLWLGIRSAQEFGLERNPFAARDALAGFLFAFIPGAVFAGGYMIFDVYRIKQEVMPLLILRIAMTAGFVAVVEEFLFRGVLLGLAVKAFGRWPASLGISLVFAGIHFLRPGAEPISDVQWWSGFAQIFRILDSAPSLPFLVFGFISLVAAGLLLAWATLATRSLWVPIGLHAGWIFCQQGLQWLARYRIKPPDALMPWVGPNVVSGAVPTGLLPLGALLLTGMALWIYLRNASADARGS
ncbi:MAG TPA: CPBP family intramembrane glutamic endopeptidase [Terrimicrobiaceae bacterium]